MSDRESMVSSDELKADKVIVCPKRKFTKGEDKNGKVKLEHVLGLTVPSNAALDCNSKTGTIAYPAGCTVVFLNSRERQSHLLNASKKTVTCLSYSRDGRYLVTGEYGHHPSVRIWDLSDNSQYSEFNGHKCGINCVAYSPNQKYVVSVGSQHDMIINVWDWKSQSSTAKIASNKVSAKVKALSFSESGDYFVTVGNRHVKFWYLQASRQTVYNDAMPLMGRSAILGEQRHNDFIDVVCGKGDFQDMVYVITRSGILCEFNSRRLLDRWVDIKTTGAFSVTAGEYLIFIGCAEAIVRCFSVENLQFVTTLPRTHYLGTDVSKAQDISHTAKHPSNAQYPDAIALAYDELHHKLTCVYNDHSLYIWDIADIKKVGKSRSYLYHCACIWGVEMFPDVSDVVPPDIMPPGSFITCSSDDTIRVWNLDRNQYSGDSSYKANIYSDVLLKIIYIDPELQFIKDQDIGLTDKTEHVSYDSRNGVRSLAISPDGQQLASGDRSGNIRIYDLKLVEEVCKIEAHDAEVLCLEYSPVVTPGHKRLLVSASRDRLIHIFDASDDYEFLETQDDHSSSITSVRFLELSDLYLISCSADKSIVFRRFQNVKDAYFTRDRVISGKCTLYDMAVDCSQKYILTACQDRSIRLYSINTGKHCKTFKGSSGEEGSIIKIAIDNSGKYVATSCTDKTLSIYDYYSGECLASIWGHSELVTGLRFSNDCERLISASGDGCVFVWRLPREMVVTMQTRMAQQQARAHPKVHSLAFEVATDSVNESPRKKKDDKRAKISDRLEDDHLPLWATQSNDHQSLVSDSDTGVRVIMPKGRWAQQRKDFPITLDNTLQIPSRESDGSKEDSSVDSGTETSRTEDRHEKLIVPQTMIRSPPKFITTVDDCVENNFMKNRGQSNFTNLLSLNDSRTRQHTDDSSLGSFKNEDMETQDTEHDGDVEDYSEVDSGENEPNRKIIYYSNQEDGFSDYKVNAIDGDELRKSQRRLKFHRAAKKNLNTVNTDLAYSVSGSQDSDDDDDDCVSTPSVESSEKNNLSFASSMDGEDPFIQREKFLKSTYESLGGMESSIDTLAKKPSITSNYLSESRNQNLIYATRISKNELDTHRMRKELKSRIDDIREKLQCVGYQSSLKSSQSTLDLTKNDSFVIAGPPARRKRPQVEPEPSGIRRACSLSDLTHSTLASPSKSSYNRAGLSGNVKYADASHRSFSNKHRTFPKDHNVTISQQHRNARSDNPIASGQRILRPTIASQNKSRTPVIQAKMNNAARRRNLSIHPSDTVDDSSSEDGKIENVRSSYGDKFGNKRFNTKFMERSVSERDLTSLNVHSKKKQYEAKSEIQLYNTMQPDANNAPLSKDLLNSVMEQFKKTADDIIRIHERLAVENMNAEEKNLLLYGIRDTIGQVQSNLLKLKDGEKTNSVFGNNV